MPELLHEIWIDSEGLEVCLIAGPEGEEARKLLPFGSKLAHTFHAHSHFEAMTMYNKYLGREPYETTFKEDYVEYSTESKTIQDEFKTT